MAQYIGQWANVNDIEIAELTMEQLGLVPLEDVFPPTPIVVADLAGGTLGGLDDMQHLGWQFVRVYHYVERPGIYIYWKCNFCYFCSYIFDQDIMHTHLLCQCEQVCSEH